jgi:F-type H+-transporting ATPase subunit a
MLTEKLLQEHKTHDQAKHDDHASGGMELPPSFFGEIYNHHVKGTEFSKMMGFDRFDGMKPHLGQFQFEGLCYSLVLVTFLSAVAIAGVKGYQKIPKGIQNFLEMCVEGLRSLFRMLVGKDADRHLPFLGTLFIFIFCMNLIGIVPFFRSPTMVLSITLALGVVTFFYVQSQGIKAHGFFGYLKHMMGPLLFLAPLMFPLELLGEFIKPISLSLRLYGNISGEDTLIEIFLNMGKSMYIPLHAPMLAFAVFTSFLQAFIFTGLTTIYIQLVSSHGDDHAEKHEEAHAESGHH